MSLTHTLYHMITQICDKDSELERMIRDWDGDDADAAACSDPSDQFVLGEEIERDLKQLKKFVIENIA